MADDWRRIARRTWIIVLELSGDTIAISALIGSVALISLELEAFIEDTFLRSLMTYTLDGAAVAFLVIFLWHQGWKYLYGGQFNVLVVA